jgi:signal transduction histidine kinase
LILEALLTLRNSVFSSRDLSLIILTNLIANAVKHHDRPHGRVEIRVAAEGELYRFEIVDDGPGIPTEYHQKVFEIFKTFTKTATADTTGIGLAIVKKLVELQGGEITLDSAVGMGTTFRFTWPLSSDIEPAM